MGNHFGHTFRISTWGESHGGAVGVVIDGCPPNISINIEDIQRDLNRRRPGQSDIVTQRGELDQAEILSGIFEGKTMGTPISILVWNKDARSQDYEFMKNAYRPSHADFTYHQKYGILNWKGGGRASARETIGRVAAGAIAKKILKNIFKTEILAYVTQVHKIKASIDPLKVTSSKIEKNPVRCPDGKIAQQMYDYIRQIQKQGDSVGGIIECIVKNVPIGLGSPVFDKLEADLAKACMSLPATKGFEIGSGFQGVEMMGSEHNDIFEFKNKKVSTRTNYSGGIQGGISNGEPIFMRIAFKPTATILQEQETITHQFQKTSLKPKGRHDPCVLPRAIPLVESMVALVLVDHYLRHKAQCS